MSMVERVAKALWDDRYPDDEWSPTDKRDFMGHARAAMEAMREPTEEMDKAARDECHKMAGVIDPVVHVWDRMIEAAFDR